MCQHTSPRYKAETIWKKTFEIFLCFYLRANPNTCLLLMSLMFTNKRRQSRLFKVNEVEGIEEEIFLWVLTACVGNFNFYYFNSLA
jgi:hypothetical protein